MNPRQKRQIILYKDYFSVFYKKQTVKVRAKIDWTIQLVIDLERVPEKYFRGPLFILNEAGDELFWIQTRRVEG